MSTYQRKYITLKEAAIISGYTAKELENLIKIGLVPARKLKHKLFVRFDAFSKSSSSPGVTQKIPAAPKKDAVVEAKTKAVVSSPARALIPFTKPHPLMIKVLEPMAFAAALVMVLYVGMMPAVASKIALGISVAEDSVAFMGQSTNELIATAISIPVSVDQGLAYAQQNAVAAVPQQGRVAGSVTSARAVSAYPVSDEGGSFVENVLIGIADASDNFQGFLDRLGQKTYDMLVGGLTFDKLDPVIQNTFKW